MPGVPDRPGCRRSSCQYLSIYLQPDVGSAIRVGVVVELKDPENELGLNGEGFEVKVEEAVQCHNRARQDEVREFGSGNGA